MGPGTPYTSGKKFSVSKNFIIQKPIGIFLHWTHCPEPLKEMIMAMPMLQRFQHILKSFL